MDTTPAQHDEDDERLAGDLLVGAEAILKYLKFLGMPADTDVDDVYYLKRAKRLPIGNTAKDGGKLIASKRRLIRHVEKITRGSTAA